MPYTEDRGIDFRINTAINLAGASAAVAKIKKPDLSTTSWTCSIYDEANGIIRYITSTVANELDNQIGIWTVQAKITFASGEIYHGIETTFSVAEVLIPTP